MQQYHDLLNHILSTGVVKKDRTGTGTISTFGYQMRFDLSKGFPLITTKKVHFKSVVHELIWFLSGSTNISYLKKHNVKIWDAWATKEGELGAIYGHQWRSFGDIPGLLNGIDQIKDVIESIKTNPDSRRHLVTAWNPIYLPNENRSPQENAEIGLAALAPCHTLFQFYVANGKLSCQLYQRSADAFLGLPFNIASYSLLTHMIAQVCGYEVGEFIHTIGDAHIYLNHVDQVRTQLSRDFRELPTVRLNPEIKNIFDFTYPDVELLNYNPHPHIKGEVSI